MNEKLSFKIWQAFEDGTWSDPIGHEFLVGSNQRYALADEEDRVVAKFRELDGRICLLPLRGTSTLVNGREVNVPTLLPDLEAVSLGLDGRNFQFNTAPEATPVTDNGEPPRQSGHEAPPPVAENEKKLLEEIQAQVKQGIGAALGETLPSVEARLEAAISSTLRSTTTALRTELLTSLTDEIRARHASPTKRGWLTPLLVIGLAAIAAGVIYLQRHPLSQVVPLTGGTPTSAKSTESKISSPSPSPSPHVGSLIAEDPASPYSLSAPVALTIGNSRDLSPESALASFALKANPTPSPAAKRRVQKAKVAPPREKPKAKPKATVTAPIAPEQFAPIERQAGAPPSFGPRLLDFTVSHPMPAKPGGREEQAIKPESLLDRLLRGVTITSLDVFIPPDQVANSATVMDPQVTDRFVPRETVPTLLGLARQLEDLGKLPPSFQLNLAGDAFAREDLPKPLDTPGNRSDGSVLVSVDALPLHRASTIPLAAARLPSPPREEKVGVRFVRLPGESLASPKALEVTWIECGYLAIAFAKDKDASQNALALRISTTPFLASRTLPNERGTVSVKKLHTYHRKSPVWSLALMPADQSAIVGQADGKLALIDLNSGEELRQFDGHSLQILAVAVSPDSSWLLSSAGDRTLRLWDLKSGALLQTLQTGDSAITAIAFSPDGKRFVVGDTSGMAILYDLASFEEIRWFMGHESGITSVAFSPDGREALTGSNDHTARLWDVETGHSVVCFRGHGGGVQTVAFSPNGKTVLTAGGGFLFGPDGQRSPSLDNTVRLWDRRSGEELRRLVGHREWVITAAFSPDGKRVVSGSAKAPVEADVKVPGGESEILLWDVETGEEVLSFPAQPDIVRAVAFRSDKQIVSAGWDQTVCVWQLDAAEGDGGVTADDRD